jgi:processing peptidase subunit beta
MATNLLRGIGVIGKTTKTKSSVRVVKRGYGTAVEGVEAGRVAAPGYLGSANATKVTTLKNGIRVATEETAGETVTFGVHVDAGSAYETEKNNGVAHFFEHMMFKGTGKRSQEDIEVEVENVGGQLNAYTSREHTVYVAKSFKKDVAKMSEILGDVFQNSKLDPAHIERERGVILQEKAGVEKDAEEVVFDYLHAAAFQGSSLGQTILGEVRNINSLTRDDLVNYLKAHYTGKRMVISAAGAVNHDEIVQLAQTHFGQIPAESPLFDFGNLPIPEFVGSEIKVRDDTLPSVTAAIAFKGSSWSDPDYLTFLLIQNLIGSWDKSMGGGNSLNSRLSEVTSNEGLAESYSAFNTSYNSTGLFGVSFVAPYDRVDEFCVELMKEFSNLRSITPAELLRAKNRVKTAYLIQLNSTEEISGEIGRQLLTLGRRLTPIEAFLRIDAITIDDVQRVAWNSFRDVDPVVAAMGPLKYFPDYNVWRTRTTAL